MVVDPRRYEDGITVSYEGYARVFTNVIDTIVSPNYPDNYGDNENRRYMIKAPTKREIVLIFNSFDVEHHDSCRFDSLAASIFIIFEVNLECFGVMYTIVVQEDDVEARF